MTRDTWNELIAKQTTLQKEIVGGGIEVEGSVIDLVQFFAMLDEPNPGFGIVLP
jgi:alkyl sulfatase BDS1-like metallo-beta-lactamase superfamily hydrolase